MTVALCSGKRYNQQTAIQRSKLVRDQLVAAAGPPDHGSGV